MVGQEPLELSIGVRVPASEPDKYNSLFTVHSEQYTWNEGERYAKWNENIHR